MSVIALSLGVRRARRMAGDIVTTRALRNLFCYVDAYGARASA